MSNLQTAKLGLLENSHAFLREAVANALQAQGDVHRWQFAILHLVQSLELSVKTLLYRVHPILIYEDVDARRHTVGLSLGLDRLQAPEIETINLTQHERSHIKKIIDLRNRITHFEFELTHHYAEAKFFEVFAFVVRFQAQHLDTEIEGIIPDDSFTRLLTVKKGFDELSAQASTRIAEEARSSDLVWPCPNCGQDTFVFEDAIDTCYTCRYSEPVVECHYCHEFCFQSNLTDFSDEWDTDDEGGRYFVTNSYGYSHPKACQCCAEKIRDDIRKQKLDDYYYELQREHYET